MKKILAIIVLGLMITSSHALTLATNITSTAGGVFLLSTNGMSMASIELSAQYPATIQLFDCDTLADPYYGTNYVNAAWNGRTTYTTNFVTSFVGYNGYTNWYTNAGLWTLTVTNAAKTNALPATAAFTVSGGNYAIYNTDAIFARGVVALVNTNVNVVINYRTGR